MKFPILALLACGLLLGSIGRISAATDDDRTSANPDPDNKFQGGIGYVGGANNGYQRNVFRHYIYQRKSIVVPGSDVNTVQHPDSRASSASPTQPDPSSGGKIPDKHPDTR